MKLIQYVLVQYLAVWADMQKNGRLSSYKACCGVLC